MEKKDIPDFGRVVEDSLQEALRSGDFSKMQHILNNTVESMVEKTIANTISTGKAASKILGENWKHLPRSNHHTSQDNTHSNSDTRENTYTSWSEASNPTKTESFKNRSTVKQNAMNTKSKPVIDSKTTEQQQKILPYVKKAGWDAFLGGFLAVIGFLGAMPLWATAIVMALKEFSSGIAVGALIGVVAIIGVATVLTICMISGLRRHGNAYRFKRYWNLLKDTGYCNITDMAQGVGKSPRFVMRDLVRMLAAGLFPQGKLDDQRTCLIIDSNMYQQYQLMQEGVRTRRKLEAENKQMNPVIAAGLETVHQIRSANSALPGAAVTEKLTRLEDVITSIFLYVEQRPARLPEIRRFMDYYLPTTLKLVKAYQEFEEQPETPSTALAKQEIVAMLDTISQAFEKLLDGLYEDDAMDVSTDISVLKTMLAQEGLTEDSFAKGSTDYAG